MLVGEPQHIGRSFGEQAAFVFSFIAGIFRCLAGPARPTRTNQTSFFPKVPLKFRR